MFYAFKDKSLIVDALNSRGIYTQKQVDKMDKRIEELWKALNEANAALMTHVWSIENMTDDYYFCGKKWTEEMKKADIRHSCEQLKEVQEKLNNVLIERG